MELMPGTVSRAKNPRLTRSCALGQSLLLLLCYIDTVSLRALNSYLYSHRLMPLSTLIGEASFCSRVSNRDPKLVNEQRRVTGELLGHNVASLSRSLPRIRDQSGGGDIRTVSANSHQGSAVKWGSHCTDKLGGCDRTHKTHASSNLTESQNGWGWEAHC